MQLSPLSVDLFAPSAPASGGASLDPAAAPFAQWLSAQTKNVPTLADPSTPPSFSQFPLNWGFPAATAAPVAPAELPVAAAGADPLLAEMVAVEELPLITAAALPKPATAPMAALAAREGRPAVAANSHNLIPNHPQPNRPETAMPKPATAPIVVEPAPPGMDPELAVTDVSKAAVGPSVPLFGRSRREVPVVDTLPQELTTAAASIEPSIVVPPASASPVVPAETAVIADSAPPLRSPAIAAKQEWSPDFTSPASRVVETQEPAAAMPAVGFQPQGLSVEAQPGVATGGKEVRPTEAAAVFTARPQQAAIANPQGQPARTDQGSGIALDPALMAEDATAEVVPDIPIVSARPSQAAIPNPQGMPAPRAQAAVQGLESAQVPIPSTPEIPSLQKSPPSVARPLEQLHQAGGSEPVRAAAVQGAGTAVVPVQPERAVIAEMGTGATSPLAAGAAVLTGLVSPTVAGNVPPAPRQASVSRPSPLWANAAVFDAAGGAEGLSAELTVAAPQPVQATAPGPQAGERSLSDQRFADLFAPPSAPAQAVRANPSQPQQVAVTTAAGFESLLPQASEPAAALTPLEGVSTTVVTAPLGQPAAPQAPASAAAPVLTLPSGLQVPEQEVLQQVFGQLSPRNLSGPQRLTLRLNPEELGEVRLEMIVDKDTVRAHLQAQSQQVQEVLEKHLPRLREAFEQQGLKLQELQVSVDSGRDGGRSFFNQSQHQQQTPNFAGSGNGRRNLEGAVTDPVIPPPAAPPTSGGLSLRV